MTHEPGFQCSCSILCCQNRRHEMAQLRDLGFHHACPARGLWQTVHTIPFPYSTTSPWFAVGCSDRATSVPPAPCGPNALIKPRAHTWWLVPDGRCWKIYGAGGAAELLGIKPTTLVSRIQKMGIMKPQERSKGRP